MSKKKEIWNRISSHFSSRLKPEDYAIWFSRTNIKSLEKNLVVIEVPNKFFARWFRDQYLTDLRSSFQIVMNSFPEIRFEYSSGSEEHPSGPLPPDRGLMPSLKSNLEPNLSFDTFIYDDLNSFAYYSAKDIVENMTKVYNPFYLFSQKSAGKTHLLHAIGNHAKRHWTDGRIAYIHADRFTATFSQAMHSQRIHEFRTMFTDLDLLLLDDVHLLEGRKKTQDELTLMIDHLLRDGKKIAVSSRKAPFLLDDMNPRLKSILGWGLLAEIQPPKAETRIHILRKKTSQDGFKFPEDIIFFLAKTNDDMKDLLRNITRLQTFASLNGGNIGLSDVRSLIRNHQGVDIHDIQSVTSGYFRISVAELVSEKRQRAYAYPRQMAMFLCRKMTGHSYKRIGAAFGKKDHSTVIYAVRRVEEEIARNPEVRDDLQNLEDLLG